MPVPPVSVHLPGLLRRHYIRVIGENHDNLILDSQINPPCQTQEIKPKGIGECEKTWHRLYTGICGLLATQVFRACV